LITKSGSFAVWKATGFSDNGGNDEATRRVTLPLETGPLSKVIEGTPYRLGPNNDLSTRLGAGDVATAVLVPMVVKEKVSGAVYADATAADAGRFDPESIAFLTFLAGLFVDRLAGRKLKPAPALREIQEVGAAQEPAEAQAPAASRPTPEAFSLPAESAAPPRPSQRDSFGTKILSADAVASEPAISLPSSPPPAPPRPPARETPREPEIRSAPSAPSEPELAYEPDEPALSLGPPPAPAPSAPPPPAPPPSAPPAPPAAPAAPAAPASPPAPAAAAPRPAAPAEPTPVARPTSTAAARRLAGPLAPLDTGDERKEEARRFAKLLVSEIKLYNEKAVLDGRQHGNLYERLKEDIDRSRQMYDERIPEDVRSSSNFFYEELVRILADGRADALGI
jgi:hypothetical protein